MAESDDLDTETDDESPDIRAVHECKTTKRPTGQCLRLPCQDPALISTKEFSPALLPQKYRQYLTSSILLPRTWSKDLERKYMRTITKRDQYFPYNNLRSIRLSYTHWSSTRVHLSAHSTWPWHLAETYNRLAVWVYKSCRQSRTSLRTNWTRST